MTGTGSARRVGLGRGNGRKQDGVWSRRQQWIELLHRDETVARARAKAPRAHAVCNLSSEEAGLVRLAADDHPLGERRRAVAKVDMVGHNLAADLAALGVRDRIAALRALAPRAVHVEWRILAAEPLRRARAARIVLWVFVVAAARARRARNGGHTRARVYDHLVHRARRPDADVCRIVAKRLEVARDLRREPPAVSATEQV